MKNTYAQTERLFEKLTAKATTILGNSITFILALAIVIFWWTTGMFVSNDMHQNIGDFIFGTTFLSLFIIQKSFNRYSALVHLKMNELIASNETANNSVMDTSEKTEYEIRALSKEYIDLEEMAETEDQAISEEIKNKKDKL
jgi:low affinity Fe/Cu permease